MRRRGARPAALGLLLPAIAAFALPASADAGLRAHLRDSSQLLGDGAGLRDGLERRGLTMQLFGQGIYAWKPRGGARRDGVTGHSASYDLLVRADGEQLAGLRDLVGFLHVKGQRDRHPNESVGAFSDPADDADFGEDVYLEQLWLEQGFLGGRVRLRAGLIETQTIFDRNVYANAEDVQFMNSVLDNDALVPLPGSFGAALLVRPLPWLELAAGLFDADNRPRRASFETLRDDAESLSHYLEATLRFSLPGPDGLRPGALRMGFFRDGRERVVFGRTGRDGGPDTRRGHRGYYIGLEQELWRSRDGRAADLGLFARASRADPEVSPIAWFASAGLQWRGALPGRPADALGLAAYRAWASGRLRDADPDAFRHETGLELYYRVQLLPWLAVTPDLQYIVEPGAVPDAGDAVLAQLRVRVSF